MRKVAVFNSIDRDGEGSLEERINTWLAANAGVSITDHLQSSARDGNGLMVTVVTIWYTPATT